MSEKTLTITDNRTGKTYTVPIENESIRAMTLRGIKVQEDEFGMLSYDPAFFNTASTKSKITYIDGDKGILRYRGYPIEQLAEKSSFLETVYLLRNGELPDKAALDKWTDEITRRTLIHENVKKIIESFRYDAHPMGMLVSLIAALSTFYPEAKKVHDPEVRHLQIIRLVSKVSTIAAHIYRHMLGLPFVYPNNDLSYTGNFLSMMFKMTEIEYKVDPVLEHALDVLFILHADHEQNCGTAAMRVVSSAEADPYASASAAAAALYGPLHGGANEKVINMLRRIGSVKNVAEHVKRVKKGEMRLMGFGHRVYKNYDPRAQIIKRIADDVFEVMGKNQLLEIAVELERIALEDDYFVSRKLYPNVDFYSGIIYEAMGIPSQMFTVLFAIGRMPGWLAQWEENIEDQEQRISRPRQLYLGEGSRDYVPMAER